MQKGKACYRTVHRFDWAAVGPSLTRKLLISIYESDHDDDQKRNLQRLSNDGLANLAKKAFTASLTNSRRLDATTEVLIKNWISKADSSVLERLATRVQASLAGQARKLVLKTKHQRVAFLRECERTVRFDSNVFKAFKEAHRTPRRERYKCRDGVPRTPPKPKVLQGMSEPQPYPLYRHQVSAIQSLGQLLKKRRPRSGVVVLPTGAGKTDTVAVWLLDEMRENPSLRVLWLAHQQQLLDQAIGRFEARARNLQKGFKRIARVVHGNAADIAVIAHKATDLAAVSIQSLAINFFKGRSKQRYLEEFLDRPTIVIVDEAHHAAAPSYDAVLDVIAKNPNTRAIVGLTATPWPTSPGARAVFHRRFLHEVIHVPPEDLINKGILARPVLQTISTGQAIHLTAHELELAKTQDLASHVLRQLETIQRNSLIVKTYADKARDWGKTLIFATSIHHANQLGELFHRHAPTRVLHSEVEQPRGEILDWFRRSKGPCVLVSVGMLTEGVDLPDARTAFLARPTTSRILLRQMIGRVLRGPQAGGKAEANLVFFRDIWTNFFDVLEPPEVFPQIISTKPGPNGDIPLPPVVDDSGNIIEADVLAAIARQLAHNLTVDGDGNRGIPLDPLLVPSRLIGYYQLDDIVIPVFEHQQSAYEALIEMALEPKGLRGRPALSLFDDSYPPYPGHRSLQALIEYVREYQETPEFFALDSRLGPDRVAKEILSAGAITDLRRERIIQDGFEKSANRVTYPSFEIFEESVEQRIRQLRRVRRGDTRRFEAEEPLDASDRPRKLPRYERDLESIRDLTLQTAYKLLPRHLGAFLKQFAPPVEWTRRAVSSTWGHWSLRLQGRRRGEQVIRINRVLRTTPEAVSDELIAYLIYHELLHSLLPGQGHDTEFRKLESLWPASAALDAEFETMHERWNLDPDRYDD